MEYVDFARAISIVGIFLCHYFMFSNMHGAGQFGRFLGGTFNIVFFCISALLFGLSWERKGRMPFHFGDFMKKRLIRLASSYWPCLALVFAGFMIVGEPFGLKEVLMNTFFLSWFCKMPGVGHFWFITMIVFCYLSFVMLSKCQFLRKLNGGGYFTSVVIICCILEYGMDRMRLPGLMIGVLLITGYVFLNASKILSIARKKRVVLTVLSLVVSLVTIGLLYRGWYELHRTTSYILMNLCGLLWFISLLGIGMNMRSGRVLLWLSAYSYEIYLVHHSFCAGPWSVYHLTHNPVVAFVLIACATALFSIPLHLLGNIINSHYRS